MPRREIDKEDLMREATALVERAELEAPNIAGSFVIGFRRDGSASFFFGADPVYQFNSAGELRRAFFSGRLIKAQQGVLVALDRQRTEGQVLLVSHYLDEQETQRLLRDVNERLYHIQCALCDQSFTALAIVPEKSDLLSRVSNWIAALPHPVKIARSPHAR